MSLSSAFTEGGVFSFMVGHMLSVGEESGNVDLLLEKLANFFKEQVRATVKRLTAAIEPILIVTMGLVVGTMVLSIFLPIIEMTKRTTQQ
jgi:type IV pilus assembly protein PilC